MKHQIISKNSGDILTLKEKLRDLAPGEMVSYAELSAAIGRSIQAHRYLLAASIEGLLKDESLLFDAVFRKGIKRLTPEETVMVAIKALRRARSIANKGVARLARTDYQALPTGDLKRQHNAYLSVLNAIRHAADPRQLTKISAQCSNTSPRSLPTARVLTLLAS